MSTDPPDPPARVRTAPLSAAERRHFWWSAPPLLVLVLAHVIFDLAGGGYASLGDRLVAAAPGGGDPRREAVVVAALLAWAAFAVVWFVVAAGTGWIAWRMVAERVRGRARRPFSIFLAVVALGGLAHLGVVDRAEPALYGIFGVTLQALIAEPAVAPAQVTVVRAVVAAINGLSVLVPALVLAAAVATALPPTGGWSEVALVRRARQVRQVVAIGAAILVAGILHMGAWTQLAGATLAVDADHALDLVAVAVTLFWGAATTLMIASFYLPMGLRLSELARGVMDAQGIAEAERRDWLTARGLSFEPSQQLPQIAAVAAPLLAGPVSGAIGAAAERVAF